MCVLDRQIRGLTELAQELIQALHARDPNDGTFSQVGLLDGRGHVFGYLEYAELGCAVHHLLYMVHESNIPFPRAKVEELHALAGSIGEPNFYAEENLAGLTEAQRKSVFNRLR
jgi:hypothetical protein